MEMDAEPSMKRLRSDRGDEGVDNPTKAKLLLDSIIASVTDKNLSNPQALVSLPFPSLGPTPLPARFNQQPIRSGIPRFKYMGRTGYANLRNTVLGLQKLKFRDLPVRPDKKPKGAYDKAGLWGTMGSGKSFMLAALACDLLASFNQSSIGNNFQQQRAIYLPDCGLLVDDPDLQMDCFKKALSLSYAEDAEMLGLIGQLSDRTSLIKFFKKEAEKGVLIYLLVDQFNALDFSKGGPAQQKKESVKGLLMVLSFYHFLVQSASANNANAKEWYRKQINVATVFHHGGLDVEEYKSWKEHFAEPGGLPTPWGQLTEEEELKVKDMTGCVPLFLQCWNGIGTTPENAWDEFIALPEIKAAGPLLRSFITDQLDGAGPLTLQNLVDMYFQFVTEGDVSAVPDDYDCRYLFIERPSWIGRCVCGAYRKCIAEILQSYRRSAVARPEWRQAIFREVDRPNPNFALLGFVVEQHIISELMQNGVPLYARTNVKCNKLVYFDSGSESSLPIEEGCTLYVPSALNYHRVDAVIRQYNIRAGQRADGPPCTVASLANSYSERELHIIGVQISLGRLEKHLGSESQFCSPEAMAVWLHDWDTQHVARWFIWFVLQPEIDKHTRDAVELFPGLYENEEVKSTTRSASIQQLDHVTMLKSLEQFEPCLKHIAQMKT